MPGTCTRLIRSLYNPIRDPLEQQVPGWVRGDSRDKLEHRQG
jgi:hypothetical protein